MRQLARSKAELEERLAEAEGVIEEAAESIERGDIQAAKASLDSYLEPEEEGEDEEDEG